MAALLILLAIAVAVGALVMLRLLIDMTLGATGAKAEAFEQSGQGGQLLAH